MDKDKQNFEEISESPQIELEKVKLNREWSFWENYEEKNEGKNKTKEKYSQSLKEIYTFDDIISFWQFWNKYPGNDTKKIFYNGEYITYFFKEKFRIIAMNVFVKGIRPAWEDEHNKGGHYYILGYDPKSDIAAFLTDITNNWIKLIINLIGEKLPHTEKINGIRFVDKTKIGKANTFKFELWVNSSITEEEKDELLDFLKKNYCTGALVRGIP